MPSPRREQTELSVAEDGTFIAGIGVEEAQHVKGTIVTTRNDPLHGAIQTLNQDGRGQPTKPTGGRGRVKRVIREASRLAYAERIPILVDIADGKPFEMQKIIRTKRKYVADASKIVEIEASQNGNNDPDEQWVWVRIVWQETADIPDRMKAVELLGKMGGVSDPTEEDGEADEHLRNATFAVSFD